MTNTSATSPHTVLIVDDEDIICTLLKRALKQDPISVLTACSRTEALDIFLNHAIDLLVVDKNLPDGSGLEFIETVKNLDYTGESILITAYSDTESAIRGVHLGLFRYIQKPFDLDALRMDIRKALETVSLRKDLARRTEELERTNTELRLAIERVSESEQRRMEAERLAGIGYLASGIAHEINNPLSLLSMTIPYTLSTLNRILASESLQESPEQVHKTLTHLARNLDPTQEAVDLLMLLSSDLHSLGKKDESEARPLLLLDAVNAALRIVRHKLRHKAQITVNIPDHLSILGKNSRLIQVFINLLTNAARAIRDEDPKKNYVRINGFEDEQHVVIEISDSGIGIPDAHIPRIFERFVTFSEIPQQEEGTGIGLSIVKEIVEEHNGIISVQSEPDGGCCFSLRFPGSRVRKSFPPPIEKPTTRQTPHDFPRTRRVLLFIDANTEHLEVYRESFETMHTVLLAHSFEDALTVIETNRDDMDVIICELGDDLRPFQQFLREILSRDQRLAHRFICTGNRKMDVTASDGQSIPMLVRPFRPAALLSAVYQVPAGVPSRLD